MFGSFAFQSSKVDVVIAIVIVIAKKEDNSCYLGLPVSMLGFTLKSRR